MVQAVRIPYHSFYHSDVFPADRLDSDRRLLYPGCRRTASFFAYVLKNISEIMCSDSIEGGMFCFDVFL